MGEVKKREGRRNERRIRKENRRRNEGKRKGDEMDGMAGVGGRSRWEGGVGSASGARSGLLVSPSFLLRPERCPEKCPGARIISPASVSGEDTRCRCYALLIVFFLARGE